MPNGFHCYLKLGKILSVQNEVENITNRGRFITNRNGYYKSGQILPVRAQNMSIVVGAILSKLKTITMAFEINNFCNIQKDKVHEQVYS